MLCGNFVLFQPFLQHKRQPDVKTQEEIFFSLASLVGCARVVPFWIGGFCVLMGWEDDDDGDMRSPYFHFSQPRNKS